MLLHCGSGSHNDISKIADVIQIITNRIIITILYSKI